MNAPDSYPFGGVSPEQRRRVTRALDSITASAERIGSQIPRKEEPKLAQDPDEIDWGAEALIKEPTADQRRTAQQIHGTYLALREQGFDDAHAMHIISMMIGHHH